jgi:cytochrome c biogenesis protein CcdA
MLITFNIDNQFYNYVCVDLHLKSRTARVSTGVQTEMFAKLLYDAWSCLQRVLVLSIFIMGWHLSGVARASDPKHDWIVEVFVKDDNALVTGALLNYTLKAPNSATATATAKKTEITILIPAGSQLVGALTVANCTPLKSPLTAKPSTVHVTVTCDCLL